jgi:hypothetical protein
VEGDEALVRITQFMQERPRCLEAELPGTGGAREEVVERCLV